MINKKSLEIAIRKAYLSYSYEGSFHVCEFFGLYQDPARLPVAATATGNIISSSIPVVLGKRVNLTGFSVTGEQFMIPDGAGFRVAATLADALAGVSQSVADGSGTVYEESITSEDDLDVLKSFQVASNSTAFLQDPPHTVDGEKVYLNYNYGHLFGPVANLTHILAILSGNSLDYPTYPTLIYGLRPSEVSSIPAGQQLRITLRPFIRSI